MLLPHVFRNAPSCPFPGALVWEKRRLSKSHKKLSQPSPLHFKTTHPGPTLSSLLPQSQFLYKRDCGNKRGFPLPFWTCLLACLLACMLKSSTFKGQSLGRLAQAGAEGAALYLKCWLLNGPGPARRWGVNLPLCSLRKRGPSSVLRQRPCCPR